MRDQTETETETETTKETERQKQVRTRRRSTTDRNGNTSQLCCRYVVTILFYVRVFEVAETLFAIEYLDEITLHHRHDLMHLLTGAVHLKRNQKISKSVVFTVPQRQL